MSDIGDIRITTSVDTSAATTATEVLNRSLLQLTGQINSYSAAAAKASSVHSTLQRITKGVSDQQKVLTNLVVAYGTAQNTTNRIVENANANLKALDATMAKVGSSSAKMTSALKAQQSQFTAITNNVQALNRALTGASIQQWANRSKQALSLANLSLIRTTAQTLAFTRALRTAFFSFADLEQESARVTKLLVDNFGSGEEAIQKARLATIELGKDLDKITRRFGTSRVLVQSLAGDFAELGISDNKAIAGLVELTTTVEKLGNVDITQSQKFIESMLQNILRVKREQAALKGLSLDLTDPKQFDIIIQELKGQLAEFNLVENKTTLSLKDLADAFPEVSAAATTFGLSMTEASALLAPMVASGFQVGASANSIKVSLQRMVAMTKQNTQIIGGLNEALGPDFDYAAGVSMENIQKLTDGFNSLLNLKGEQGTLELFARLFGVRQGPRMETSIRQLAVFQKALDTTGTTEERVARSIETNVNQRLKAAGMEEMQLKKIVDISNLHRAATEKVNGEYTTRAKIIRFGQEAAFKDLNQQFAASGESAADFLSKIGTESGKILMSSAFRIEDVAQKQLETELEIGLQTTITQFRILKEEILAIGRVLVSAFGPIIRFFNPIIQKIRDFLEGMGEGSKKLLSFSIIALALLPTLKILGASFRYFYVSAIGGIAKLITGFGKFGSKLISVTDLIDRGDRALKGWQKAIQISPDKILLTGRQRGAIADTTGLSPSLREARAVGATPTVSTIKAALRASVGLPVASTAMVGLVETAADTTVAAAEAAMASAETLDAFRTGISDAFKAGFKGTTFVSNRFLGNTFGGKGTTGAPGTGGRGGGGAPASGGTTTTPSRRVPARPIYGPPVPPPESRPIYGPEFPVDRRPVFGPAAPPDTRPIFGPAIPPDTRPIYGPKVPKVKVPKVAEVISKGATDAAAVVASTGAAIGETIANVSEASTSAVTAFADSVKETTEKVKSTGRKVSAGTKVAKGGVRQVPLNMRDIRMVLDKAGAQLPAEWEFLRTLDKEWMVATQSKKKILNDIEEFAKKGNLSGIAGPLGKVNVKKGAIQTAGVGRALKAGAKGETGQIRVIQDLLEERMRRASIDGRLPRNLKPLEDLYNNLTSSIERKVSNIRETQRAGGVGKTVRDAAEKAKRNAYNIAEGNFLKTKFKGLTLSEKDAAGGLVEKITVTATPVPEDMQKALMEERQAFQQFRQMSSRTSKEEEKIIRQRLKEARKKVEALKKLGVATKPVPTTTSQIVPASKLSRDIQELKSMDNAANQMLEAQRTPGMALKGSTDEQINKNVMERARRTILPQKVTASTSNIKAALEISILEKEKEIAKAIAAGDKSLLNLLKQTPGYSDPATIKRATGKTKQRLEASNRMLIRRLAEQRADLSMFDIDSEKYDPSAQQRLFTKSSAKQVAERRVQREVDERLTSGRSFSTKEISGRKAAALKEGKALEEAVNKVAADNTAQARTARQKLATQFNKTRAALLKRYGSLDKAEEALAAMAAKEAAKSAALPTAASVAASTRAPVVTATGAGAVRTPTGVARVFFSDAVRAASSAVTGATKTVGSEIARLLDDVLVKAIPAGFDPAKAKVIRAVVGEVLAKTPITAASAATPAAQKFMATVLGTMGPDIARVIDTLTPQITEAISAGGISAKGGIIQSAKARTVSAFNKLKGVATAKLVGDVAMLRTGIEAAVFDAIAAAGYAVESTTSSVAEALRSGTFSDAMLPGYLDELTEKRGRRSAAAVESGARGGAVAAEGKPSLTREERNVARRKKRAVERLMKERGIDATAATTLYDEAVKSGDDAVKELLPDTRKKVKDAVKEVAEAPAKALTEASEAVGETVAEAKEEIVKSLDEAVEAVTPAAPVSKPTPKSPVVPGAPATGPPIIDVRTTPIKDIRSGIPAGVDKIGSRTTKEAIDKISALRKEAADITKELSTVTKDVTGLEKAVASSTGRLQKLNQQALDKARNTFKKKTARLIQVNKELDTIQRNIDNALKKVATPAAAATTGAAATGAAAGAAPAGARGPRVPGVSVPTAAPTAAVATSAIVEKLDDVIVEFDRSLANFFKGPNFFQGPNYFAGPLTVMPNAKFKDYKKSIKDATPSEKDARLRTQIERTRARRARDAAAAPSAASVAAPAAAATGAVAAAKAGIMSKIGATLGSALSKSAGVGLKAVQAGFGIIGKSSAEFFKMSIAFIDMYANALGGATASSKLAAGATKTLAVAKAGLNSVSRFTTLALNKAAAATIAFGRAVGATTRAELATFIASLQKSKILKMWGFLLFTGMMPAIKGLKALTIAGLRFMLTLKFGNLLAGFQALYQSILRTTLSVVALGIKLNAAMLMIAPVLILVFSIISKVKRGISGMSPAMDNFKAAWFAIKDAIYMLAAPLENMIAAFGGLGNQGNSVKRTAGVVWLLSRGVRAVAEAFQRFAMGPGTKYMQNVVVPIITRLVNRFILLGRAISNTLSGNTARASKDFKGFLYSMLYELIAVTGKFVSILATGLEMFAPTLARMIDAIVAATISAFRKILMFVREVMMLIGAVVGGIGLVTGNLPIALKGAAIAGGGAAFLFLDKQLAKFEESARTGGLGAGEFIANGIASGARGAANGLDKLKNFVGKKYGQEIGRGINDALGVALSKDMPKDVRNAVLKSADDANAGGESLGQQIAKGIKKGLQDLKEEFTDKFFGKADSEVDKFVEKLKEGLENQKEKALEAFDNQVEAIEALAEAEERLTAKIEYEEKRREMIRERALNKENYLRERKVAAYEGRSEDVRSLDLSFRKSSREEEKNLNELDLDRARTLQAENRQNAIKVINKEKENLIKEYEKMFKNFDEKIELIKSRGFSTEAEFRQMFTNLQNAASGFSDDIAGSLEKSMMSLPAAIRQHSDPSIGMFGMTMGKLVDEAKKSFGVGISSADTVSILGAAYSLVNGMPSAFREGFNQGIVSTYVTPFATKVKGELASIVPSDLWVKSAGLAIQEMVNEMKRKLVGLKGTLYDDMKKMFGEMTEEDWNRIFNFSGAFSDLESLKGYFSNLFPTAEKLKKQIVTIETTRSSAESGGSGEKPKAGAGLTPSEVESLKPGNQDMLVRVGKGLVPGPIEPKEDPKKGYFSKLKDIIVGIAEYLGPVKTAILGFVGIVAGAATALPIWTAIKGVLVAVAGTVGIIPVLIGTAVGVLIYLYARFKAVRDIVNGVAIAIWDSLVSAFNSVKDLSISIKDAFVNMWNAIYPSLKRTFDFLVTGFEIAGGAIWKFITLLIAVIMKPLGSIFGGIARVIGSIVGVFVAVFGPAIKIIVGGLLKGIEAIIFYLNKFKEPIWKVVKVTLDIINPMIEAIIKVFTVPFDIFFDLISGTFDLISKIIYGIWDVIFTGGKNLAPVLGPLILPIFDMLKTVFGILVGVFGNVFNFAKDIFGKLLDVIRVPFNWIKDNVGKILEPISVAFEKMGGVLSTVGSFILTLILAPFKLFFELIKKIAENPVVNWFLRLAAMLALVAAITATWGVKIALESTWWVIKKVAGALADLAGFIYNVVVKAFTFMKDLLVTAWNTIYGVVKKFIDWWHDNVGSLWLLLIAGFVVAYEVIKRLWSFLSDVFVKVWDVIKVAALKYFDFVKGYVGFILDIFKTLAGWLGTVFTAIWDVLKKAASMYWDYLKFVITTWWGIIKTVAGWLGTAFTVIWDVLKKAASLYWEYLKTAVSVWWTVIKTVAGWLGTAFTVIWSVIKKAASLYWEYLKTAVNVWWNVIKTVAGWLGTVFTAVWGGIKTAASAVWDYLQNIVPNTWNGLKKVSDWIVNIFTAVWGGLRSAVGFVWDLIKSGLNAVYPALQVFANFVGTVLSFAWEFLKNYIKTVWDIIMFGWGIVSPILSTFADVVGPILGAAWDSLKIAIGFVWDALTFGWSFISPILEFFAEIVGKVIAGAWDVLKAAVGFVWDAIKTGWDFISPILEFFSEIVGKVIGGAWDLLKQGIEFVWDAIKIGWNAVSPILGFFGDIILNVIGFAIDSIKNGWNTFINVVKFAKDVAIGIFNAIGDVIGKAIGLAISAVIGTWNGLKTAFKTVFDFIKPIIENIGSFIRDVIGGAIDFISAAISAIPSAFKTILNGIAGLFNRVVGILGNFAFPEKILNIPVPVVGGKKVSDFIRLPYLPILYNGGKVGSYMKGGMAYGYGGMTKGFAQQAIPAILHGGEYVINHKAVKRIGTDTLDALNNMRLSKPRYPQMPSIPNVTMPNLRIDNSTIAQAPAGSSTQNVNIYVDTFVGEPEWFNSMMKEYNTRVLPRNQKAAGLQNRVISTYNGLNRGG